LTKVTIGSNQAVESKQHIDMFPTVSPKTKTINSKQEKKNIGLSSMPSTVLPPTSKSDMVSIHSTVLPPTSKADNTSTLQTVNTTTQMVNSTTIAPDSTSQANIEILLPECQEMTDVEFGVKCLCAQELWINETCSSAFRCDNKRGDAESALGCLYTCPQAKQVMPLWKEDFTGLHCIDEGKCRPLHVLCNDVAASVGQEVMKACTCLGPKVILNECKYIGDCTTKEARASNSQVIDLNDNNLTFVNANTINQTCPQGLILGFCDPVSQHLFAN